jgi:hypothetical protein
LWSSELDGERLLWSLHPSIYSCSLSSLFDFTSFWIELCDSNICLSWHIHT